jgi:hypothetical protein
MKSWLDRLVICKIVSDKYCVWYCSHANSLKSPERVSSGRNFNIAVNNLQSQNARYLTLTARVRRNEDNPPTYWEIRTRYIVVHVKEAGSRKEEKNTVVWDKELPTVRDIHFLCLQGRRKNCVSNMGRI